MKIIVGTRGSHLAFTQTSLIVKKLESLNKDVEFEIKIIKTKGDKIQDIPLHKMNDKGIFVKEIEEELIAGKIDMAVHSMKDMPTLMDRRLDFPVIPKREDPRDVLIIKEGCSYEELKALKNITIGTGSKRRVHQLKMIFPNAEFYPIRGNIDTRIRKLKDENLDAIMIAASGIKRIGRESEVSEYMDEIEFIPAPCQGILALQTRKNDQKIIDILMKAEDSSARIQYRAERAFLAAVDGGCHVPVGAYCEIQNDNITIYGIYGDKDGNKLIKDKITGLSKNAESLGTQLGEKIKKTLEV